VKVPDPFRWLPLLLVLAACGSDGVPVTAWSRDGHAVTLPGNAWFGDLPRASSYTLHASVHLPSVDVDQPHTLSFECFHGALQLRAGGVEIPDVGDVAVGEHRFLIGTDHARDGTLELDLLVKGDPLSVGFGVAPRLASGLITEPSGTARFNRQASIVDLALIAIFALLSGLSYMLDRRRVADGAFAIGVLVSSVAPLAYLGLVAPFGRFGLAIIGASICGANLAVIYFLHASFELGPKPRLLIRIYIATLLVAPLVPFSNTVLIAWNAVHFATDIMFLRHVIGGLWRAARGGPSRLDARLLIVMIVLMFAIAGPDLIGIMLGHSVLDGLHTLSLGAATFAVAQAIHLARDQVARQRALEQTGEELRRQVAERSRELHDALAKLARQPGALVADRTIDDRYRVVKKIGAGGMGAVYEVERISDGKRFALKTLRGQADTDLMARFAREAQIAADISHPNLVPVLDVGISDGALFLVMPLVGGGSLEQARSKFGMAQWAKPLLVQIAEGLAALHARDIVHRDLKPGNVLLVGSTAQIADFGLAAVGGGVVDAAGDTLASGDPLADTAAPASPLTQRGDIFGTPAYMAPELAAGTKDARPSSDIFAFGVIAVEMLTGRSAFAEPPVMARLHGRAIAAPVVDGVPPIIARCLDLDPTLRPTAGELAAALRAP
jgi:tRNA A-37 threonylcarbamoyl transferase component Bud32